MSTPRDQTSPPALEITQHDIADAMTCSDSVQTDASAADGASSFLTDEIGTVNSVRVIAFKLQTCCCLACIQTRQNNDHKADRPTIPAPSRYFRRPKIFQGQM